ncbi:MAG: MlaD family protein [Gemmatimonadetes bacterium]|nr:MlaD family protein [Gemmatimonadota bacterium]
MSMHANPTRIGLFMIGAIVLAVVGVASLASTSWMNKESTFVSYFNESVNGLDVGAAVKFQGVPVGHVTDLLIQIGEKDKTFQVPVQYDVDLARLTSVGGGFIHLNDKSVLRQQIADGLRAQLQMESIVTGQLYIELVYRTDAARPLREQRQSAYPEIPTSPSLLAAFGSQAGSVVSDVLKVLIRVNEMLDSVNVREINRSVVASAAAVERLAGSKELQAAIDGVPEMTAQLTRTMSGIQALTERLDAAVGPLQGQMDSTSAELTRTLQTMQQAVEDVRGLLSTDSGVGYQMVGAMASLKEAADAMREFSLSLQRNPDMLIRGRKSGGH